MNTENEETHLRTFSSSFPPPLSRATKHKRKTIPNKCVVVGAVCLLFAFVDIYALSAASTALVQRFCIANCTNCAAACVSMLRYVETKNRRMK